MARRLLWLLLGALAVLPAWASASSALPPAVAAALKSAGIAPEASAWVVQAVDAARPQLAVNAQQPMNPASLMKLVTTLAALETLGPTASFRTEALASGPLENGVLMGDLILRGSGDPKFTHERLWLLLRELRGRGLKEIRGELVLDRSAFAPISHDPAAFDGQPLRPYNVGPDALLFNFAALTLTLSADNGAVRVLAEPWPEGLTLINRLRAVEAKSCPDGWREGLSASFSPGQLTLVGDYPRPCQEKRWHLAGLANGELLSGVFSRLWRELGGSFSGRWREGLAPANATLLAVSESPPLAELVRDINKFSNNVMARQLFLKLGAGETAQAERAVRAWLERKGLDFPELVLDNGAGLSRKARISAGHLARLLAAGWASPVMPEFIASLPIAAQDGTVRRKFNGHGAAGQAHLKTGSLEGVRGLAGYVLDRAGRRWIVVGIVNHPKAEGAQPAFDALLAWLWQGGF